MLLLETLEAKKIVKFKYFSSNAFDRQGDIKCRDWMLIKSDTKRKDSKNKYYNHRQLTSGKYWEAKEKHFCVVKNCSRKKKGI